MSDVLDFFGIPALLTSLPPALAEALEDASVTMPFSDGQTIHARGDDEPCLSIVKSGAVRLGQVDVDGRYSGMAVLGPGQFFGEFTIFANLPRSFDAVAIGPTIINEVSRLRFDRLLEKHRGIREHFLWSLAHRLHAALRMVDDLRRLPLNVRAAKMLFAMTQEENGKVVVRVTQSDLADLLGVTRASANKVLNELEKEGLIERSYGRIVITVPDRLRAWIEDQTQSGLFDL